MGSPWTVIAESANLIEELQVVDLGRVPSGRLHGGWSHRWSEHNRRSLDRNRHLSLAEAPRRAPIPPQDSCPSSE